MNGVSIQSGAGITAPALIRLLLTSVGVLFFVLLCFSGTALAKTFTVNDTNDLPLNTVNCDNPAGQCSLRAAILASNGNPGPDTIIVPPGVYTLTLGGANENDGFTGDLDISGDVTITGAGGNPNGDPDQTIIQAGTSPSNGIDRIFDIYQDDWGIPLNVTIQSLTIRNGRNLDGTSIGGGGGIYADPNGGKIQISNCIVIDNYAGNNGNGGGIYFSGPPEGTIEVEKTVFRNNTAEGHGGGIYFQADSTVHVENTTIEGNTAVKSAGGLYFTVLSAGKKGALIEKSTISNNTASDNGGGMAIAGLATVENVTVSGNTSQKSGGGILINVTATNDVKVTNVTAASNNASISGGGLHVPNGVAILHNTIVAGNSGSNVSGGSLDSSSSYNLIGTGGSGGLTSGTNGNLVNVPDPMLGPLQDNGGFSKTRALLTGSPALDAGSDALAAGTTDQRGASRKVDGADVNTTPTTDIGALEAHPTISDISDQTTSAATAKSVTFYVGDDTIGFDSIQAASSNTSLIPNSNLVITGSGGSRTLTITPAAGQHGASTITVTVIDQVSGKTTSAVDTFQVNVTPSPDLTITKTHTGDFYKGQNGATYTIRVTNSGVGPTSGTVTVTESVPTGLTITGLTGSGWTCDAIAKTCTRFDALNSGSSYPDIIATVNVSASALAMVTNTASVTGGGETNTTNNSANDPTTINGADLKITKSHTGNFYQGQTGATYTIHLSNEGTGETNGTVTVTDILPTGLTLRAINGTGWTCNSGTNTCTRTDVLAVGSSYEDITVTVDVAANAPTPLTNTATVSGGGDANASNNSASDLTAVIETPSILSVSVPASGTYGPTQQLEFTVAYSRDVTVAGTPTLPVTIGSKAVNASYVSGSNSTALLFRYTIVAGDSDDNGIALGSALSLDGGTIKDEVTNNDANLTINGAPPTGGIKVDAVAPAKPVITITPTGWTNQDVTATITGEAGSVIQYKINAGIWENYTVPVTISQEGQNTLTAKQQDAVQNVSAEAQAEVNIDKTAPVITLKGAATINVYKGDTFTDPGVTITDLSPGLTAVVTGSVDTSTLGTYTLQYDTEDLAGNQAVPVIRTVKVVNRPITPPVTYPVTGVSLDEEKLTLTLEDDPVTLHATVTPENATNKEVIWRSGDSDVVTVSEEGVVMPVAPGKATITVTTVDGNYKAECIVIVEGEQTLFPSEKSFVINPNKSTSFKIYVLDEDGERKDITKSKDISYKASNSIISVKPGLIRAGKVEGESVITVSYQEQELEIPVTVTKNIVRKLESSLTKLYLPLENSKQITVKAIYNDQTSKDVTDKATWTTSNKKVATVSDTGEITAVRTGTATITASYAGKKISVWVKAVEEIALKSLSASKRTVSLDPDETEEIKLTAIYEDGTKEDVSAKAEWATSRDKIAVVEKGIIKGVDEGRTRISATYKGKTISIYVTVK